MATERSAQVIASPRFRVLSEGFLSTAPALKSSYWLPAIKPRQIGIDYG